MNREAHYQIVEQRIKTLLDSLGPQAHKITTALEQVGQVAFEQGRQYALGSLLTVDDLAKMFQVTPRRVRAKAQFLHSRFGVGYKVPGTRGTWLFAPEEIEQLRPAQTGRPKSK